MDYENFIAKRIIFSGKKNLTKLILKIAYATVGISVAAMILSTTIINGFKYEISKKIFGFWGHIDITNSNMSRNFDMLPIDKTASYYDSLSDLTDPIIYYTKPKIFGKTIKGDKVRNQTKGGIDFIRSYVVTPGIVTSKKEIEGAVLKGADHDFHWRMMDKYMIEGDTIEYVKDKPSSGAVISTIQAKRLGLGVGDKFIVHFIKRNDEVKKRFKVVGIYNTGMEEYDRKFVIVDIRKLQEVLHWDENEVAGFEVFLDDIDDLDVINNYIYYEIIPNNKYAETIKTKFSSIFEWLNLQDTNEALIIALMLLVAVINMISTLLILILEQTHLIGVLKSLGATNWKIRKIFLYQAWYIITKGLVMANIIGIGLALLQKYFRIIKLDEVNYFLSYVPIRFDIWNIALINLGAIVIILISLIIPSYMVSKMNPVKALRIS